MVLLKSSSSADPMMATPSPSRRTRKQAQQASLFASPVKLPARRGGAPLCPAVKASPSKAIGRRTSSALSRITLKHPVKPVGRPWPVTQLKAFDMPTELSWGRLLKEVLRKRGWTVRTPCHATSDGESRLMFTREFEASIRGLTPEKAFGKRGAVQQGYALKAIAQPKHALWMMSFCPYRVPGTYSGRAVNREDFAKILMRHGNNLPGESGTVNHRIHLIPGLEAAMCKDRLSLAFRDESWYPIAYVLPAERHELLKILQSSECASKEYWIAKPRNECCGAGIAVYNAADPELVKTVRESEGKKRTVVQKYLHDPLLIGGYKFHMRILIIITSTQPLQAFVQRGGQCLFATKPYTLAKKTLSPTFDPPVHVTNMGLNALPANKENYLRNKPVIGKGQQMLVRELEEYLEGNMPSFDKDAFWRQIALIATKMAHYTVNAPSVRRHGKLSPGRHWGLLGMDLMVDRNLKVYMCETNDNPGLCHADKKVLGSPNPDYGKETRANTQTWHDVHTLLGHDAARHNSKGSLDNWYELDFSEY